MRKNCLWKNWGKSQNASITTAACHYQINQFVTPPLIHQWLTDCELVLIQWVATRVRTSMSCGQSIHPSICLSVCPSHMHIFSILPTLKKTHLFKQTHLLASVRIVFDIKTTSKPRKSSSETSQSQRNRRNNNKKSSCHSWHKVTHAKQIETLTITTTKLDSLKQQQQNRT